MEGIDASQPLALILTKPPETVAAVARIPFPAA